MWQVSSGRLLYVCSGKSAVLSVVWAGSEADLICGMEDGTIACLSMLKVCHMQAYQSMMLRYLYTYHTKDVLKVDGFLAHRYPVERFAFSGTHLASGAHKEVKIWLWSSKGELPCFPRERSIDSFAASWTLVADLPAPRRSSVTTACDIIATSLHWTSTSCHPSVLLVTYLSHGIA